jgi:hypothetical protein
VTSSGAGDPDHGAGGIVQRFDGQVIHNGFACNRGPDVLPRAFSAFQHLLLDGRQCGGLLFRQKVGVGLADDLFRSKARVGVVNPGVAKVQS